MYTAPLEADQKALSDMVFGARTIEEIEQAENALRAWLADHPERQGMDDGFEILSHRRDFLDWMAENPEEAKIHLARRRVQDQIDAIRSLADVPAAREALQGFQHEWLQEDASSEVTLLSLTEEAYQRVEKYEQDVQASVKQPVFA